MYCRGVLRTLDEGGYTPSPPPPVLYNEKILYLLLGSNLLLDCRCRCCRFLGDTAHFLFVRCLAGSGARLGRSGSSAVQSGYRVEKTKHICIIIIGQKSISEEVYCTAWRIRSVRVRVSVCVLCVCMSVGGAVDHRGQVLGAGCWGQAGQTPGRQPAHLLLCPAEWKAPNFPRRHGSSSLLFCSSVRSMQARNLVDAYIRDETLIVFVDSLKNQQQRVGEWMSAC